MTRGVSFCDEALVPQFPLFGPPKVAKSLSGTRLAPKASRAAGQKEAHDTGEVTCECVGGGGSHDGPLFGWF